VVAVGVVLLLATNVLHVFPAASLLNPQQSVWSQLHFVWAPAITLALICIPYVARMVRQSTIEVLESDYVAMARLKGVRERRVIWRHALVNGAGPTVQAIGLTLGYLAGSTLVVETVFQYPGIGLALYNAVQNRDLPVVQALVLLIAVAYILINITTDLVTILISPRLRTELR
jgi:peptide/nickel transport system permease protein